MEENLIQMYAHKLKKKLKKKEETFFLKCI